MLPAGAFAVVLMLGGAQIMLPAPAFVEQGRVWAPGREVLQRLGLKVTWRAEQRALVAARDGQELVFPETPPPWPVPSSPAEALYARRVQNLLYIPLLALRNVGMQTAWDPAARRATVADPAARTAALSAILNDPADWVGRSVTLVGEYMGWDDYPFCYATRPGAPVGTGDWVLAQDESAIYCTPAPIPAPVSRPGLAASGLPSPLLTPYNALGRRVTVSGRIALSPAGVPYLRYTEARRLTGAEGVSCRLVLDELTRAPGQTLTWEVVIYNPGPTMLTLPHQREMLVSVAAPGGSLYISKQSYGWLTEAPSIAANDELTLSGSWTVPADGVPGTYFVVVRLADVLRTSVRRCEVVAARP